MKQISTFKKLLLVTSIVLIAISVKADYTKKIHKNWQVNKVKALNFESRFSDLTIINSRTDSVIVDVEIKLDGISGNKAEKLTDEINVNFSIKSGELHIETIYGEEFRTKESFTVNYNIYIPSNRHLTITNRYGNVTLGNLEANGNFNIDYGTISGGNLEAPNDSSIYLELKYGKASFKSINSLTAEISYSPVSIDAVDNANINSRYSVITIDNCANLVADTRYDSFKIEAISSISADSKFSQWKVERLTQAMKIINQYGNVKIDHIDANFDLIDITNKYGNIHVGISESTSYNLKGESKYCKIKHPHTSNGTIIAEKQEYYINAIIGEGEPHSKIIVETLYGNVDLME